MPIRAAIRAPAQAFRFPISTLRFLEPASRCTTGSTHRVRRPPMPGRPVARAGPRQDGPGMAGTRAAALPAWSALPRASDRRSAFDNQPICEAATRGYGIGRRLDPKRTKARPWPDRRSTATLTVAWRPALPAGHFLRDRCLSAAVACRSYCLPSVLFETHRPGDPEPLLRVIRPTPPVPGNTVSLT